MSHVRTRPSAGYGVGRTAARVVRLAVLLWGIAWLLGLAIRAVLWLVSVSLRAVASLYDAIFTKRRAARTLKV